MAAWAQPVLKGDFILAEEGGSGTNRIASLSVLTFDGKGSVRGNQFVQMQGNAQLIQVSGAYTLNPDGSGALVLQTQVPGDEGSVPAIAATYDFLQAKASGFAAVRKDGSLTTLAKFLPAGAASNFNGEFIFETDGLSASGQSRAEIATIQMRADGTLNGKLVISNGAIQEPKALSGSYAPLGNGLWSIRFLTPGEKDPEDGTVNIDSTSYYAAFTAKGELIAIRSDATLLGLAAIR